MTTVETEPLADAPIFRRAAEMTAAAGNVPHRGGLVKEDFRDLHFFDDNKGVSGRMTITHHRSDFISPRHRHTFVNMRYIVAGKIAYGKNVYGPGDLTYIPEANYYGPLSIPASDDNSGEPPYTMVTMQIAGTSGIPYLRPEDKARGFEELSKTGVFDNGIYRGADGHNQDSYEAIHQYATGEPVVYPQRRLDDYVVVHGNNVPWNDFAALPGVRAKHFGYFTELGPYVRLIQMDAGASTPAGCVGYQQARWILDGTVSYGGEEYDAITLAYYPADVPYLALEAKSQVTMLVAQWATRIGPPPPLHEL